MACTNGPLTYLRTLKNASSFFYNSFVGTFKWWPISWNEIQWHETHVFSHIQDPLERRHKGILENILTNGCTDLLKHDKNFQQLVRWTPCLDEHTESLFAMYGSWCYSIDWIPVYPEHDLTTRCTEILLKQYGQRLFPWDNRESRPSSAEMKQLAQLLRDLWASTPEGYIPGFTKSYLARDTDLYAKVMEKFNPQGANWQRCSWLRPD
jgi:hypothetical protein